MRRRNFLIEFTAKLFWPDDWKNLIYFRRVATFKLFCNIPQLKKSEAELSYATKVLKRFRKIFFYGKKFMLHAVVGRMTWRFEGCQQVMSCQAGLTVKVFKTFFSKFLKSCAIIS